MRWTLPKLSSPSYSLLPLDRRQRCQLPWIRKRRPLFPVRRARGQTRAGATWPGILVYGGTKEGREKREERGERTEGRAPKSIGNRLNAQRGIPNSSARERPSAEPFFSALLPLPSPGLPGGAPERAAASHCVALLALRSCQGVSFRVGCMARFLHECNLLGPSTTTTTTTTAPAAPSTSESSFASSTRSSCTCSTCCGRRSRPQSRRKRSRR